MSKRNVLLAILITSQVLIFMHSASAHGTGTAPGFLTNNLSFEAQPTPPGKPEPPATFPLIETAPDFQPPEFPLDSAIRNRPGFNSYTLPANDDGYTDRVPLGFTVDFFQQSYTSLFVNNNGNVTFDSPQATFTPYDLTSTQRVIIAPFFADVDTRGYGSGLTRYGRDTVDGHPAFGVNWFGVGYYARHTDKLNTFQLVLIDRSDVGPGSFDIEFNYAHILWETGDLSGGSGGFGGYSARAGYSNGTRAPGTFYEIYGSAINGAFLDSNQSTGLIHHSSNSPIPGRYRFVVRNGTILTPTPTRTATPTRTSTPPATYSVSGRVTDASGYGPNDGVPGVTIRAGDLRFTTTDAHGYYTLSGLPAGTHTIIPSKTGFTFSQVTSSVTVPPGSSGIDFKGYDKPPIVFVHGWNGGDIRNWSCDQVEPHTYFEQIDNLLLNSDYYVEYARLNSSTCYTPPVEANVTFLKSAIVRAKQATNQPRVILVAHSMGGLVARAYIEGGSYEDDVSELFTLGTPHLGTPVDFLVMFADGLSLGAYCRQFQPAVCDFTVQGMMNFNSDHDREDGVKYHLISGDAPPLPRTLLGILADNLLIGPDDGAVPSWSGWGLSGHLDRRQTDETHIRSSGPRNYFARDGGLSTSYLECLKPILVDRATDHCGIFDQIDSASIATASPAQHTPFLNGLLLPGQTNTRPIALEGGATIFAAQWQPGTVSVTLIDPSGQMIDPAYAAAHPEVVAYQTSEGYATYTFVDAAAGTWQMRLQAADVPAAGSAYTAFAIVENTLALAGGTHRAWYLPGTSAVITATLSPVPQSANVVATVLLADETSVTVPLIPQGNGHFQAAYLVPSVPGYAEMRLTATGTNTHGAPFERGTTLAFQISPGTISLNGLFSDTPDPRWPGSSIYDALNVSVGVTVNTAGSYGISADIVDSGGHHVAHANAIHQLSGGNQALSLEFAGSDIYASQLNGPYTLTNLLLTDHNGATLVVQEAQNTHVTAPYRYRDFRTGDQFLPALFKAPGGAPPVATPTPTPTPSPTATSPTSTPTPTPSATFTPTPTTPVPTPTATPTATPTNTPTPPPPLIELVGQMGGTVNAVAVAGSYAYVGVGVRLVVVDTAYSNSPVVVGQSQLLPAPIEDVTVAGSLVYVAAGESGLHIFDVSSPANPVRLGGYDTAGRARGVTKVANLAYVADGSRGLQIIDVTNPANPVRRGGYATTTEAWSVTIVGNLAYLANGGSLLQIIDVSDPANPWRRGGFDLPDYGQSKAVTVIGNLAYIADANNGLLIVDVTNPANPVFRGGYGSPDYAHDVVVAGNLAYVADGSQGLLIIDVTNPANPWRRGGYDTPGLAVGLALAGNLAYVADYDHGLHIIDVTSPSSPWRRSSLDTHWNYANDVVVASSLAFVAHADGMQISDLGNPVGPLWRSDHGTPGYANGVAVAGSLAFIADGSSGGLRIVDVSNPTYPVARGWYDTPGYAYGVAVADNMAYVADWGSGLQVIDVDDPANPVWRGWYDTPGTAYDVVLANNLAFVADGSRGLQIIDVNDPTQMWRRGGYDTPGDALAVTLADSLAYIADGSSGLQIVDLTNPANPVLRGSYDTPGYAADVAIAGNLAFIADGSNGMQVIDVSNPANPVQRGSYVTPGNAQGITVAGNLVLVASREQGLLILRLNDTVVAWWRAEFWNNETLSGLPVLTRSDTTIDFDWRDASPGTGVNADHFSARWTRRAFFDTGGLYQFRVRRDDGARLWIDGTQVFNAWQYGREEHFFTITLGAGLHDLRFETYEINGWAQAGLAWNRLTEAGVLPSQVPVVTATPLPGVTRVYQ